jgi:hypothetical protein
VNLHKDQLFEVLFLEVEEQSIQLYLGYDPVSTMKTGRLQYVVDGTIEEINEFDFGNAISIAELCLSQEEIFKSMAADFQDSRLAIIPIPEPWGPDQVAVAAAEYGLQLQPMKEISFDEY